MRETKWGEGSEKLVERMGVGIRYSNVKKNPLTLIGVLGFDPPSLC